jgi:two-component system, cell cycle sensor histidine kinase and response regulator CckA
VESQLLTSQQIQAATARSYDLLDALPNPIYVWRRMADGGVHLAFANAAGFRETRGRVHAVLGCELHAMYGEADPGVVAMIMQTLADGEPRRVEHEYRFRSTGQLRWFRTSYMRTTADEVVVENEDLTERRRHQAEIEASEARFRSLFEQGLTAMSLTRFDGSFIKVNAAFCELLGFNEAQLLATTFMQLTHPDDLEDDVRRKDLLVSGATSSYRMEKRFIHADGHVVYADLSARMMRDAHGAPLYLLAQMQDITARRKAEVVQRRERTRLAELLERAPALICTFRGPTHLYEMANEECRRFLGRDDVIGLPVGEVMPELAEQGLVANLDRVLATGEPFMAAALPAQVRMGPGALLMERHFNVTIQPIEEVDGTRSGTFVYAVDVTGLVSAAHAQECLAEELRANQERHELVLTATRELIYDWDIASDSVFYSDALYTAFRHRRGSVEPGYAWWVKQLHPDDRESVTASLMTAVERGDEFWASEYRFRRGDGGWATVLDRGHIIRGQGGAPIRVIGSRADMTERRQLELQLRESQKMEAVGRLAGGVAHDFNNLLCAILGYADLALADQSESSTVRDEIEEIRKAAQRAAQLTKQLLAFGRRQIRRPTRVDVDAVVRDTDRLLTQLLGEHIQLTVHAGARGAALHMDPSELDQILVNLAVNARDAMPRGGIVTIETSRSHQATDNGQSEFVLITVADTGTGIDDETMPHIFEPFFTTKGEGGNGLGLSTVYGIVEQNGGRIEVDSSVGLGTRFSIYLPVAPDSAPARHTPVQPMSAVTESATVLLVEDENAVRILAHRILERAGYHVFEARHGADALLLWRKHADEIDVVVTDLVMPEMGGRALADAIRGTNPTMPILFMSGYSDDEMTRRGVSDSHVAFLAKPFSADSLVGAVREAMRQQA